MTALMVLIPETLSWQRLAFQDFAIKPRKVANIYTGKVAMQEHGKFNDWDFFLLILSAVSI